ncbi:MAG: hypothetical protein IPL88_01030 [Rhizobiales bacterium]|nr:hypothetical protein [Hyphomicrobiales bacterium]
MPDSKGERQLAIARREAAAAFLNEERRYSPEAKRERRQLRDKIHAFEAQFDQLDQRAKDAIVSAFKEHGFELSDQSLSMILNYAHVYFREREGSKVRAAHTEAARILLRHWDQHVRPQNQPVTLSLYDRFGEPSAPSSVVRWIGDELQRIDEALMNDKNDYGAGHWRAAYTILINLRDSNELSRSDARLSD